MRFLAVAGIAAAILLVRQVSGAPPLTIPDGRGGALTALASVLWGGDGSAGNVFFWHNRTFLRAADPHRLTSIAVSIRSPMPGVFVVRYEHYGPNDARCCPSLHPTPVSYRWNGKWLSRTNLGSGFHGGKTLRFPNGLAITLLTFEPATGLTQNPGGPPLRPRRGYQFVATTWKVRNTTNHTVTIASWVTRSHGLRSREFVIGNAGQMGLVPARAIVRYYWLFDVARVGRVSIYYGSFRPHWSPRG